VPHLRLVHPQPAPLCLVHRATREGKGESKVKHLWILVHEHRHGVDVFPMWSKAERGDLPEITPADVIERGGSTFEPEDGEDAEWVGPWEEDAIPVE